MFRNGRFAWSLLLKLAMTLLSFAGPLVLSRLIAFCRRTESDDAEGFGLVLLMFAAAIAEAMCDTLDGNNGGI